MPKCIKCHGQFIVKGAIRNPYTCDECRARALAMAQPPVPRPGSLSRRPQTYWFPLAAIAVAVLAFGLGWRAGHQAGVRDGGVCLCP